MVFSQEFKQKTWDTLQFNPFCLACMSALDSNNPNAYRLALEMALDDVKAQAKPRIILDEGDRLLWNGIVNQYNNISNLYAEFMLMYTDYLDQKERVTSGEKLDYNRR